jgi:hypothetical protein
LQDQGAALGDNEDAKTALYHLQFAHNKWQQRELENKGRMADMKVGWLVC